MAMCDNLAHWLNKIRRQRGLSVSEFANELEIARSSLQSMLNGTANPRANTIEHIAGKLSVNPISLLSHPYDLSVSFLTSDQQQELAQLIRQIGERLEENHE